MDKSNIAGSIIVLIIWFLLFYFLIRFSSKTKTGLNVNNLQILNSGLGGLAGYAVTVGICLIIILAFVLLLL